MRATQDNFIDGKALETVAFNCRGFGQQRTHGNSPRLAETIIQIVEFKCISERANRVGEAHGVHRLSLKHARRVKRIQRSAVSADGADNSRIVDLGLTVSADELLDCALRGGLLRSDEMSLHIENIRWRNRQISSTELPKKRLI
jgi:hypothetical protein